MDVPSNYLKTRNFYLCSPFGTLIQNVVYFPILRCPCVHICKIKESTIFCNNFRYVNIARTLFADYGWKNPPYHVLNSIYMHQQF